MTRNTQAFSLIELVVSVAIMSILTIAAVSTYSSYARKGRRADGLNTLLAIALKQERYRSNNAQYGNLTQVWGGVTTSSEGYYTLSITNISATGYTATSTAIGNQASDAESGVSCTTLQLVMSNGTITKSPASCWVK